MDRGRRGSHKAHRVGAELPVLLGSAIWFGCAPVQIEHELQVLIGLLLVRQRPVVRASVTPPAALRRGLAGGHLSPGEDSGAGGTQQVDETGQDADTQKAVLCADRLHCSWIQPLVLASSTNEAIVGNHPPHGRGRDLQAHLSAGHVGRFHFTSCSN